MVLIRLGDETIRDLAHALSQEHKTWDELVWLFAEGELRILSALVVGHLKPEGGEVREVEVDPTLLVDQPPEEDIRVLATEIAKMGPTLSNLHWFVAERRYIFNRAKVAMKKSPQGTSPHKTAVRKK